MSVLEYIIGAVIILFALVIIGVVLLQEGRQANLGAISGAAENFMDKGRARTLDAFLSKWTKILIVVFFLLVLAGMMITHFVAK